MSTIKEYLVFRKFLMPIVLQILFWAGVGGTLYGTWWLYVHDNWAWIMSLVFGLLGTRLIFETLMIRYQTYLLLKTIQERLDEKDS